MNFQTLRASLAVCLVSLIALFPVSGSADEGEEELAEMRARMERLEQQNRALQRRLDRVAPLTDDPDGMVEPSDDRLDARFTADEKKPAATKAPAAPEPYEVGSDTKMNAYWKNGVEIESKNKDFRLHIGGRTQMDLGAYNAPDNVQFNPGGTGAIRDGFNFRRGRLRADGVLYDTLEFVVEYDFINSAGAAQANPAPTDGYFTFSQLPAVGNFRIGLQKDPIGFEHLTSSRYLSFMERSFNQDAFYGGFNNGFVPGLTFYNQYAEERGTWAAGLYKVTTNAFQFNTGGGEFAFTSRLTYLPWYVAEGRGLIHTGVSYRHAAMDDGIVRHRARGPERSGLSSAWPVYANTGNINGDGQDQVNGEFAAVFGPLNLQADYMVSMIPNAFLTGQAPGGTAVYHGGYIEALWFLTGEHRVYNKKSAVFERVTPFENAFLVKTDCGPAWGRGAWQAGVRLNHLDLNSEGINGGILDDITLGLNWFLNPNLKLQSNYSVTHRQSADRQSDGIIQGLGFRLAHDF